MAIDIPLPKKSTLCFELVGLQDGCITDLIGFDIIIYSYIDRTEFWLFFWKIVDTG